MSVNTEEQGSSLDTVKLIVSLALLITGIAGFYYFETWQGEAVSFARHFIANPDLVERLRQGLPLARFDRKTLYSPGPEGYSDYPQCETVAP